MIISATLASGMRPDYNWDLLGYVGVVLSWETRDAQTLHEETYALVRKGTPSAAFRDLTEKGLYRARVAHDAGAFSEQLPIYAPRLLYVGLLSAAHRAGLSLVSTTVGLSALACVLSAFVLLRWYREILPDPDAQVVALLTYLLAGFLQVARLSTPDALAGLFTLLGIYSAAHNKHLAAVAALGLLVLVRPDGLVLCYSLLVYMALLAPAAARMRRRSATAAFLGLGVLAGLLHVGSGGYDWATIFWHAFKERILRPSLFEPQIGMSDYAGVFGVAVRDVILSGNRVAVLLLFWVLARSSAREKVASFLKVEPLLGMLLLALALRFCIFPSADVRFFFASYAGACVLICSMFRSEHRSTPVKA